MMDDVADDFVDRDAHVVAHALRQPVAPAERVQRVDDFGDLGQLIDYADFFVRHVERTMNRRGYDTRRRRGT
jgi:hypothetical protein